MILSAVYTAAEV